MIPIDAVCVYCGSSPGADPAYGHVAAELGRAMARRAIRLVYGGGHVGLMGVVADAALEAGAEVHGVITQALLDKEVGHAGVTELHVVDTMHERKALMADLAGGFIMLPGGFGTLDEFFEALTWTQLGVHAKPCGILDVNGYFDPLVRFLDSATEQRFVTQPHRDMVVVDQDPAVLLERLASWMLPSIDKWLDRSER
jgi:uncharacterized protein (TIGR00730 family)